MQRNIKLVVLDLDGTIYSRQFPSGFSARVRQTIAAVQAAGIPVTIATGRIFDFVHAIAPILNITLPVITAQGAVLGDPTSGEMLYEALIPIEAARNVAAWADSEDRTTVFYLNQPGSHTRLVQNQECWTRETYDHWFGTPREIHPNLSKILHDPTVRPLKFITVNDHTQEPDLTPALQLQFGNSIHMSRSHQLLVEGTAPQVNKGNGLLKLIGRLGINPTQVMTIGDNENDIPMMRVAGLAVAMGQATPVVQAEADWIAPSLEEDGAAIALERFVLA